MAEREINVIRKKTLFNNSTNWYIQIDGKNYDIIHGGESKKIILDEHPHTLSIYADDPNIGQVDDIYISSGNTGYTFHTSLSTAMVCGAFRGYIKIREL